MLEIESEDDVFDMNFTIQICDMHAFFCLVGKHKVREIVMKFEPPLLTFSLKVKM